METSQIILTVGLFIIGTILVPLVVAMVRYRKRQEDESKKQDERLVKLEAFNEFLKSYLLRNAVLDFHNNPNPKTDRIIEKIAAEESVTPDEIKQLEEKIQDVADHTNDTKKRLKAEATLELMKWVFEELEPVEARNRARNDLFNE